MTQVTTTPDAVAPADAIKETFSRGQVLLGLIASLIAIAIAVGGPVYGLFQRQDRAQMERQNLSNDNASLKREVEIHRADIVELKIAVKEQKTMLKDLKENSKQILETVRDLDRAQWRK